MKTQHQRFIEKVKAKNTPFLTGYFVGGDPTPEETVKYIKEAVKAGMDAVEIGIPSPNPFMDGDIIKRSHARTFPHFQEIGQIKELLRNLKAEVPVPIWIMGYHTDIIESGLYEAFLDEKLMDGLIVPDFPIDEMLTLRRELKGHGVSVIPVINNDMRDAELEVAVAEADLIYCQLYKGKTGSATPDAGSMPIFYEKIRGFTDAVLMAGFGVKNFPLAKEVIESGFQGVIVGSGIVGIVEE
ncbi:MAG TPA: tryptophan synthase subunit alpha, partial [Bacillaceae bacterium]